MLGIVQEIFQTDTFMPHGHCYLWESDILWMHVISDVVIGISYFSIPVVLACLILKRKDFPFNTIFVMFGAFILLCGTTHFLSVYTTWFPTYRFEGIVKVLTALVSFFTAIELMVFFPKLVQIPSSQMLEDKNKELKRLSDHLETEVLERTKDLEDRAVKLEMSESQAQKFLDAAPIGMIMIDQMGRIVRINSHACQMFGYDVKDILGEKIEILVPKNLRENHVGHRENFFNDPQTRAMGSGRDLYGIRKNGQEFPVEIGLNPIQTQVGRFVLSSIIDITERKTAEQNIQKKSYDLEQKNKELDEFASIVSHDLKAPLRGIGSLVDWLYEDNKEKLDAEGQENLESLKGRVVRMNHLIDGILAYSRLGRVLQKMEMIDMNKLLADVIDILEPPENIKIDIVGNLPAIKASRIQMEQLFQNLLSNAIKYMDKEKGKVEVSCFQDGLNWHFKVKDNGPGIPSEFFERIFKIFQTLKPRDRVESTGIGLSIVKKIVELHSGQIWPESTLGQGTTFHVSLPIS